MTKSTVKEATPYHLGGPILLITPVMIGLFISVHNAVSATGDADTKRAQENAKAKALKAATAAATMGFAPSLEMMENTDFLLTPVLVVQAALSDDSIRTDKKSSTLHLDAIMELHAPVCRTHVVLFVRFWVTTDSYRASVVWGEPHASAVNFPIYPPTLNVASDPNRFVISHQLLHMYDGVFRKPLGLRGPFRHRFNSYSLSDVRFAEREILDQFKSIEYDRADSNDNLRRRQHVLLPERPITVGFAGEAPTITVNGESRKYPELETVQYAGGRRYTIDYQTVKIGGQDVPMPACIVVRSGDGTRVLRSARLYNYISCEMTPDQIETDATRFSVFDPHDMACRELLLRYWMKPPGDVSPADENSLQDLCTHFRDMPVAGATVGEQLKRVNLLMQLDWMQEDMAKLETDFRKYLSLLSTNGLDRMILFGGQNAIEITIRWAQFRAAERLLPLWLDAALLRNDPNAILDFASANLATSRFWTTAKLMEKAMSRPTLSVEQRFLAQAYHAITLSGISRMASDPDHMVRRELDIAQVRWSLIGSDEGPLLAQARTSLDAARRAYASVTEPSQECRTLRKELDTIGRSVLGNGRSENEDSDPQGNGQIR